MEASKKQAQSLAEEEASLEKEDEEKDSADKEEEFEQENCKLSRGDDKIKKEEKEAEEEVW